MATDNNEKDPSDSKSTRGEQLNNSFPIAWKDWSNDLETKTIIDGLVQELRISLRLMGIGPPPSPSPSGSPRRKRGRPPSAKCYEDVARRLLLNLWRVACADPAAYCAYSRTEGDYSGAKRKDKNYPKSVTYTRVVKVIAWVSEAGWCDAEPGFYDWNKKFGRQSLLRATPAFIDRMAGSSATVEQAPFTNRQLIRLKDEKKKPVPSYKETGQTKVWCRKLKEINAQIASSKFDFALSPHKRQEMMRDLRSRNNAPDFSRIQLYRSFNVDWEHGGRFYGGWWINLPREYRRHITIDGEATEEPDFSAYHISMVYAMQGLTIPKGDPYNIGWDASLRPMVKKLTNVLLYAENEDGALQAMQDFRDKNIVDLWAAFEHLPPVKQHGRKDGLLAPMLRAIKEKHAQISHYFGAGKSTELQFYDSQIAELVLMASVFLKVTVLPVHDSFIMPASSADRIEQLMQQSFQAEFGQSIDVKR